MSPEQLAGQPVDARSDLYSAALVIHEALTAQLPYVSGKKLCELCPEASPSLQDLLDQCLKPNPAERPPSAVEVYLRLQELGKASGILLLPPGAMDKLVAARQANQPTIAYVPPEARGRPRRLLLAAAAVLLVLVAAAALAGVLYFRRAAPDAQHESLLGVSIGDRQQDVLGRLRLVNGRPENPWADDPPRAYIGHLLRPGDLGLPDDALSRLDVKRTEDNKVCIIFYDEKVRAVVVREPHAAETARGLKVGDRSGRVMDVYPEEPSEDLLLEVPGAGDARPRVEVRRYDALGVGFEMHNKKVTAVTLNPPNP
jgi:hypothetical protein